MTFAHEIVVFSFLCYPLYTIVEIICRMCSWYLLPFKRKYPPTFTATTEKPHGKLWSIAVVPDFILTGDAEDDVDVGREEFDEVAAAAAATRPPAML